MENYLISEYRGDSVIKTCQCCGVEYLTNINRTRCSELCAKKMKNKRYRENAPMRPKYEKERLVYIHRDIFGFISKK